MDILYGVHAVEEALRAGRRRFDHVLVARERQDARLEQLVLQCRQAGVRVRTEPREQLTQLAGTAAHQGVVAVTRITTSGFYIGQNRNSITSSTQIFASTDGYLVQSAAPDRQRLGVISFV